jgi:hypothetical protein
MALAKIRELLKSPPPKDLKYLVGERGDAFEVEGFATGFRVVVHVTKPLPSFELMLLDKNQKTITDFGYKYDTRQFGTAEQVIKELERLRDTPTEVDEV